MDSKADILENQEWKVFKFCGEGGVFDLRSTSSGLDFDKSDISKKEVPYITRTANNNGWKTEISLSQNAAVKLDPGDTITIGLDTQTVFYQPREYYTGQNIQVISHPRLNRVTAMFVIPVIRNQVEKFTWGANGATLGRLERSNIMLPANENGEPDWDFMEWYIGNIQGEKIKEIIQFYEFKLKEMDAPEKLVQIENWGEFSLGDIFKFIRRTSVPMNQQTVVSTGGTNYVAATNRNNGVSNYVKSNPNIEYPGNTVVFVRNGEGSMGYSVYKKESFIATSDVTVGTSKHLNEYNGKFITTIADRVRSKYNYYYKRSAKRLKAEILTLPVDLEGSVDWLVMEDYVKFLESQKIIEILKHLRSLI